MKYAIISLFLVMVYPLYGQVKGRLIDTSTDEPVAKALIVSGSEKSFSEADGTFSVKFSDQISVYATGYHMMIIKADSLNDIVIRLQPMIYNLSEVSVTAYQSPQKLRSVAGAVSLIQVSPLQNSSYNIISSLAVSPGLYIQEATPGTTKLTLRGVGSRYPYGTKKIKMFFDEIPLYSAEGETYFDEINPEYLSRIEILRGPASSLYGASLGGAVLLYPQRSQFGYSGMSLSSSSGSYGYLKNTLTYTNGKGKDDLLISLSDLRSDGYRENSRYRRNTIILNYTHPFSERLKGSLLLTGSLVSAQIPSSIDSADFLSDPRKAAPLWLQTGGNKKPERIMTGYKIRYQASDAWDISGSIFGTFRKNEENRPFNFLDESGVSYGGRILTRYVKNKGKLNFIVTSGSNLFFEVYKNSISENPGGLGVKGNLLQKGRESLYQVDLFSQLEIKVSEFTFTGGLDFNRSGFRFIDEFSYDTVNQSGYYNFNPVLSPRLSVTWNPLKNINLYVAVNHGFTVPSLSETLTPLGLINRGIKPEKAWSYETGLRLALFRDRSFIDIALYRMRVSDLIVPKRVEEDFYVGLNAGASLHKGIELALQQWLWGKEYSEGSAGSSAVVNLSYSANSFRFLEFTDGDNNFSGKKLPGIPEHFFSGSMELKTAPGIYSQIEVLSSGNIPLDDINSHYSSSWTVLNGILGYSYSVKKKWVIDTSLGIRNLTGTRYASMVVVNAPGSSLHSPRYYYPGMPRWFTFSIGLKYKFITD